MYYRIFLCAAFLLFGCGCRNGSLTRGESVPVTEKVPTRSNALLIASLNQASKKALADGGLVATKPVKIAPIAPLKPADPCSRAACPMIYCPNSLPPIPSQGICCPRCVKNPSCNVTACPKYKCAAGIKPANLSAGECCDGCAPVSTTASPATTTAARSTKKRPAKDHTSESSSSSSSSGSSESVRNSSSSESDGSSSSDDSDEKSHRSRQGCFIRRFKGKGNNSRIIRILKKSLARCRHRRFGNRRNNGERLLIQ